MTHDVKIRRLKILCDEKQVYKLNGRRCKFVDEHSRRVFECGDYIIKIDTWNEQNRPEWEKWKEIEPEDRKFFAEIIGYKDVDDPYTPFSIVVQRKIKGVKTNKNYFVRWARSIAQKYDLTDICEWSNFFVVTDEEGNKHPVIFDMGM